MTTLMSYFDDSSGLLVLVSVADLVGGVAEAIAPALEEKFSIFFPARWIEKRVYATSNTSENVFFAYDRTPPLRGIAPPFHNSRSTTD